MAAPALAMIFRYIFTVNERFIAEELIGLLAQAHEAEARYAADVLIPAMNAVREAADVIEGLVADDLWPLPTYQEMMYIL